MLISEMEVVLKSLDQRVGRIAQILPTLATKAELRDEIRGVKVLVEDVRGDVRVVHDRIDIEMAGLNRRMDERFDAVGDRFDVMEDRFAVMQAQFDVMQARLDEVLRRLPPR